MLKGEIAKQLMIQVENKIGALAHMNSLLASSGINMIAICAYAIENVAAIMVVTEDNNEARSLLEEEGFEVREEEVVLLSIDNKPGALKRITDKISEADIDLRLMYGSVDEKSKMSRIVIIAENNLEIMLLIKTELERS